MGPQHPGSSLYLAHYCLSGRPLHPLSGCHQATVGHTAPSWGELLLKFAPWHHQRQSGGVFDVPATSRWLYPWLVPESCQGENTQKVGALDQTLKDTVTHQWFDVWWCYRRRLHTGDSLTNPTSWQVGGPATGHVGSYWNVRTPIPLGIIWGGVRFLYAIEAAKLLD